MSNSEMLRNQVLLIYYVDKRAEKLELLEPLVYHNYLMVQSPFD